MGREIVGEQVAALSFSNLSVELAGVHEAQQMRTVELAGVHEAQQMHAEKRTRLLDACSATFSWGSLNLIYGRSGSGKSTLLSCMTGLAQELSQFVVTGDLEIAGHEASTWHPCQAAQYLSCVFQNPDAHIIHGTVEDEIAFSCENAALSREETAQRINTYTTLLKLDPKAATQTLSGGQKERLCVAAALACGKKILLLDEPLASLDKEGAKLVLDACASLAHEGYCIIVCDHRTATVAPYCDRAFCMDAGHLYETDPRDLIHDTPEFVAEYASYLQHTSDKDTGSEQYEGVSRQALIDLSQVQVNVSRSKRSPRIILELDHFTIFERDFILLMGDNGAGKSTLLNVLAGTRKIKRPGLRCCKARVGFVWQNPEFQLFGASVEQEMLLRNGDVSQNSWYLAQLGLEGLEQRHPFALSDGQKRRLVIAGTLAAQPDVILMDEPFAGQDQGSLMREVELMCELQRSRGAAVVMSTHDVRGILPLVNRIVWVEAGRIVGDVRYSAYSS